MSTTNPAIVSNVHEGNWAKVVQDLYTAELEDQVMRNIYQTYGDGFKVKDWIDASGNVGTVKARSLKHFEEGAWESTVVLGTAIAVGSAGASISILLDSDEYDSNGACILRVGDDVLIPATYQTAGEDRVYHVTTRSGSASAYTFTALPFNNAGTNATASRIATEIPIGTEISIISRSFGYGTGQPEGLADGLESYTSYNKIIKETFGVEGGQVALARYFDGAGGKDWSTQEARALLQMKFRFDSAIDGAIFKSEVNDNASLVETSNSGGSHKLPSFDGVYDVALRRGILQEYATTYTWDDLADIRPALLSQGITIPEVSFLVGHELNRDLEDLGLDVLKAYSGGSDLEKNTGKIGMAVKGFTRNGLNFLLAECASFNNPNKFGNAAYEFTKSGLIVPNDQVSVSVETGGMVRKVSFGRMHKLDYSNNGENRGMVIGTVAGLNGMGYPITTEYDEWKTYALTEFLFKVVGGNGIVWVRPA